MPSLKINHYLANLSPQPLFPEVVEEVSRPPIGTPISKRNEMLNGTSGNGFPKTLAGRVQLLQSQDYLTGEEIGVIRKEFEMLSSGEDIEIKELYLSALLKQIVLGEHELSQKLNSINSDILFILKGYFIDGKTYAKMGEDLKALHLRNGYSPEQRLGETRQNASHFSKVGVKEITDWLSPYGATEELVKKVLSSYVEVRGDYTQWYTDFNNWLANPNTPPKELKFENPGTKSSLLNLLSALRITIPKGLKKGSIVPVKTEHGFVLEVRSKKDSGRGEIIHKELLMANNAGNILEKVNNDEYWSTRHGTIFSLVRLMNGYGPEDLKRAFSLLKVSEINRPDRIAKNISFSFTGKTLSIPIPYSYKEDKILPYLTPEDFNSGKKRVVFLEPKSREPVVELLFTEERHETNFLGKYADFKHWGARNKATHDSWNYLTGNRTTKPILGSLEVRHYPYKDKLPFITFGKFGQISLPGYEYSEILLELDEYESTPPRINLMTPSRKLVGWLSAKDGNPQVSLLT